MVLNEIICFLQVSLCHNVLSSLFSLKNYPSLKYSCHYWINSHISFHLLRIFPCSIGAYLGKTVVEIPFAATCLTTASTTNTVHNGGIFQMDSNFILMCPACSMYFLPNYGLTNYFQSAIMNNSNTLNDFESGGSSPR